MDAIISSALEEICSHGSTGLSICSLWSKLSVDSPLCPFLKASIWKYLLLVPTIQFEARKARYSPADPSVQCLEDAEKLDLTIIANERLRDNFLGIYDAPSNLSSVQRRVLERIAIARSNGITQSQLAKEFGIEGKNLFYIVRNLECRGLIVRQPALVRTTEHGIEGETKTSSCVSTNMMYLHRYARHLGSQQRFEINKEDYNLDSIGKEIGHSGDGFASERVREDVLIKDFLPAMQAVCDKLEEANGQVLVISDIKQDLGYTGSRSGHKGWRSICRRLKDAQIVEEFDAVVNEKVEHCLRLLKKFSPKDFESTAIGSGDNLDVEKQLKFGRTFRRTEQLLELPIEHQIHDMVDAEGSEGLAVMEVCDRLGIDKKRNYSRLCNMFSRFGMHLQAESHRKTTVFRVWTSRHYSPKLSNIFHSKSEDVNVKNNSPNSDVHNLGVQEGLTSVFLNHDYSTSGCDFSTPGKMNDREFDVENSHGSSQDGKTDSLPSQNLQESMHEANETDPDADLDMMKSVMGNIAPTEMKSLTISKPPNPRAHQAYLLTADNARREQRILQWLQDEKFLLRIELYRRLLSLEKDKGTKMDRKTIDRILSKLQQQGHCKRMVINVPVVTNCGRNRSTLVVLHPSVQSLTSEILGEIHDRLRSFEIQSHGQASTRWKNNGSVPVLNDVQRTQNHVFSDARASRSEVMRANGFVAAKMVRAKLLHGFLWDYFSATSGWDNALSSRCNDGSYQLFSLEAAVKAIPLELFLQVAGSTQTFDDMVEKCKKGMRLSDLPAEEYKLLMDTLATGRLSLVIDMLRRLKLIRLVSDGHVDEGGEGQQTNLTHAMELMPYIEEPVSIVVTSGMIPLDLRPRIRHDLFLSNREAVDEYWQTLEYCYAAADPMAAIQAFPGSAVHEVFLYRSWASVRVMTAEQRAELLKRILNDNKKEKLPFRECEKIAKDLNLTLEQVLRVYYDKRKKRLKRLQGVQKAIKEYKVIENNDSSPSPSPSTSQKRKRSRKARSVKSSGVDTESRLLDKQEVDGTVEENGRERMCSLASSREHDQTDDHQETVEEPGSNREKGDCYSLINQSAFPKMNSPRQRRFSWTDEADRKLVIEYVRHRAALGAKFHRVDWASLPELPASPIVCRRRMSSLKRNIRFRKAVMSLCNMLSRRYTKHLEKNKKRLLNNDDCTTLVRPSSTDASGVNISKDVGLAENTGLQKERWDDLDDKDINRALEDVLQLKRMTKLEASKRVGLNSEEWSNLNMDADEYESERISPTALSEDKQNLCGRQQKDSASRSRYHHLRQRFIKLLSEEISINRRVHDSLAISNAVELLKLVFLSTSTAQHIPNLLAETLRRYSERDLFAAYSYLREKKIMIGGTGGQPFVLSQQFLHNVSKSPFPVNTGNRASRFSIWLHEREQEMMAGGIHLHGDLQCGDVLSLFSLVSSGELSIAPLLPKEGIGETEDLRSLKRRNEDNECTDDKAKKFKFVADSELISRREKGFPGIMVSIHRVNLATTKTLELFKEDDTYTGELHRSDGLNTNLGQKLSSSSPQPDYMKQILDGGTIFSKSEISGQLTWEAMATYAEKLISEPSDEVWTSSIKPEIFKAVFVAIQKAGDQGLSMDEVSSVACLPGRMVCESIIDVLQAFGKVLKVNCYDSFRVVDVLYHSKFFLSSTASIDQNPFPSSSTKSQGRRNGELSLENNDTINAKSLKDGGSNVDLHRVTILNRPEEDLLPSNESQTSNKQEGSANIEVVSARRNNEGETLNSSSRELCMPILPWINADGTINRIIYNGLIRRVLGTVMQNPGILEDEIVLRMDVLNPQSCKQLLELMILDGHLKVREMLQTTKAGPPALLGTLLASLFRKSKLEYRKHLFANPMCASLL